MSAPSRHIQSCEKAIENQSYNDGHYPVTVPDNYL